MPTSSRKVVIAPKAKPSRDKVRDHRQRLRALGLRPIQIWVPDTRLAAFAAEAHRQSRLIARSKQAAADQAFIDVVATELGE